MTRLTMATALTLAALAAPACAQAPTGYDHSHSGDTAKPVPADPAPGSSAAAAPQGGIGRVGMMNDMKGMMGRMSAMHDTRMMHMMGRGTNGMATIDRIEGRIAFLRVELKIADAQADSWNGFADALRANARKLAEVRASMTPKPDEAAVSTLATRLEQQEQWLAARLEGTRAMKSAYIKLNELLSDDQKKTANELLAPHLGMGAMAMMATPTPLEQKEQGRMPGMGMGMGKN